MFEIYLPLDVEQTTSNHSIPCLLVLVIQETKNELEFDRNIHTQNT